MFITPHLQKREWKVIIGEKALNHETNEEGWSMPLIMVNLTSKDQLCKIKKNSKDKMEYQRECGEVARIEMCLIKPYSMKPTLLDTTPFPGV